MRIYPPPESDDWDAECEIADVRSRRRKPTAEEAAFERDYYFDPITRRMKRRDSTE